MVDKKLLIKNYAFFLLATALFSAFQTSLWSTHLSGIPSPYFWLPTLAYWALYRHESEFLIMVYLTTFLLSPLSSVPLGLFLIINTTLTLLAYFLKQRLYQPGAIFYMLICGGLSLLYPIVHWVASRALETNPVNSFSIYHWLLRSLLTTLLAMPLYALFVWIDDITQKELPTETGRQFQ